MPIWRDIWFTLHHRIGEHPALYYRLFARRYPFNRMRVTPATQICIEGYPRSANSYAVVAFKLANPEVPIAHHLHVPAQLLQAVHQGIPTVLVVRTPAECVPSFMVFQQSRNPAPYLRAYIRFHQAVHPVREQLLVADFQQVVTDFNQVIAAINRRFGTQYQLIEDLPAQQERIFQRLEEINRQFFGGDARKSMRPDPARQALKCQLREQVVQHPLFAEALEWYERFRELATPTVPTATP